MKKRILISLLAVIVVMATVLTGCGSNKKDSKTDYEYVKDKGTLVIGLDDTFAPMGFRNKKNELVGFDIDLAKAVCKEMGLKAKFKPIDWTAKEAELNSKKIDCIWNGMSATSDRQKSMSLSKKYLANRILVMTLDPNINVTSSKQFKHMKIGTQGDSSALEAIKNDKNYDEFKDNVKEYKTYDEAILDMKAGRVKCIAIDEVYAIYNNKNKTKLYTCDFNFGADYYAVGFRKKDTELTSKFDDALKAVIDSGEAKKISKKWFGKDLVVFEGYDD
ncbi:MAG: amino acid ABC transporter substrate-binding protein [Anaerovoracaceae bacterium]